MPEKNVATAEENFKSSLEDVIAFGERLLPYCDSVQDLIEIAQLALSNDGQLALLLSLVTGPAPGGAKK